MPQDKRVSARVRPDQKAAVDQAYLDALERGHTRADNLSAWIREWIVDAALAAAAGVRPSGGLPTDPEFTDALTRLTKHERLSDPTQTIRRYVVRLGELLAEGHDLTDFQPPRPSGGSGGSRKSKRS